MSASSSPFARIVVVGGGLVGGSFALASRDLPGVDEIRIVDPDQAVREQVEAAGFPTGPDLETSVGDADLVLVAAPVPDIGRLVIRAIAASPHTAVVTDVGSVKSRPVAEVESFLEENGIEEGGFVGGHPMAGSESRGFGAADGRLFQGATWILTPTSRTSGTAVSALAAHLRAIGARVLAVDPDLHDRLVAVVSHLPQVVASALADEADVAARETGEAVLSVAAGGFRDVTRIASSDPDLWTGILEENRAAVVRALDAYTSRLHRFREAISKGDWAEVRDRLQRGRAARSRLPAKQRAGRLVDLVIAVPDRPGVLADVVTTLGNAGVNIEDLALRHAAEGDRGALVIAVEDTAVERARELLTTRGYASHAEPR